MPKRGIDQLCIRRTPLSVLGTSGGPSWAQALFSSGMSNVGHSTSNEMIAHALRPRILFYFFSVLPNYPKFEGDTVNVLFVHLMNKSKI